MAARLVRLEACEQVVDLTDPGFVEACKSRWQAADQEIKKRDGFGGQGVCHRKRIGVAGEQ
eukprot:5379285-Pleurochrysis_carterae.AAC.2